MVFTASMIATGREPSLPPDLEGNACASPSTEDPVAYVDMVRQRLALTHQQMTSPPAPVAINPYHEDDLIFVMTTPPERTSKLAPRWKGPFLVKRVPNAYQVTYEDDMVWRTVHVNHMKPTNNPCWRLPRPCVTTCPTIAASYVPLEEFYLEKASQTSSTSRPYRGVTSTSRPCRRANPASRCAQRSLTSPESAHQTLISQ